MILGHNPSVIVKLWVAFAHAPPLQSHVNDANFRSRKWLARIHLINRAPVDSLNDLTDNENRNGASSLLKSSHPRIKRQRVKETSFPLERLQNHLYTYILYKTSRWCYFGHRFNGLRSLRKLNRFYTFLIDLYKNNK